MKHDVARAHTPARGQELNPPCVKRSGALVQSSRVRTTRGMVGTRRSPSNNLVKKPKQACSPHERQAKAQGDDCLRPHLNQAGFSGCPRGSVRILRRRLDLMHTSDKTYHVRSVVGLNRWSSWLAVHRRDSSIDCNFIQYANAPELPLFRPALPSP
jgi:hypothetical protein